MTDLIINIGIVVAGLVFIRFLLARFFAGEKKQDSFLSEYSKILNDSKYKVKRSFE